MKKKWWTTILVRGPNGLRVSPARLWGEGETSEEAEKDAAKQVAGYPEGTVYFNPEDVMHPKDEQLVPT